jgi:hypothetical protein
MRSFSQKQETQDVLTNNTIIMSICCFTVSTEQGVRHGCIRIRWTNVWLCCQHFRGRGRRETPPERKALEGRALPIVRFALCGVCYHPARQYVHCGRSGRNLVMIKRLPIIVVCPCVSSVEDGHAVWPEASVLVSYDSLE